MVSSTDSPPPVIKATLNEMIFIIWNAPREIAPTQCVPAPQNNWQFVQGAHDMFKQILFKHALVAGDMKKII